MNEPLNTTPLSRREQIMQTALTCFVENGFTSTTIDMIREKSGASIGSLYHHFRNKEDIASALYIEAMSDHFSTLRSALDEIDPSHENIAELGIKTIVLTYGFWVENHPELAKYVFLGRSVIVDPEGKAQLAEQNKHQLEYLRGIFSSWIAKDLIRRMPVNLYHAIVIGPVQEYSRQWLAGKVKIPLSDVKNELAEAAWRGISV